MSRTEEECGRRPRQGGAPTLKFAAVVCLSVAGMACGGGGGGGGASGGGGTDYPPDDGASGTATLSWAAPVEREDGRALSYSDIGGYRIHFGPVADPDQYVIEVGDSNSSQYIVTGLDPDTWSFAVTVLDTDGLESGLSNRMTKVIAE